MRKKLLELAKRAGKKLWTEGLPGHLFSPLILLVALGCHVLAGLGVGRFFELVNAPGNQLVELYFISLGGVTALKLVKKVGTRD